MHTYVFLKNKQKPTVYIKTDGYKDQGRSFLGTLALGNKEDGAFPNF